MLDQRLLTLLQDQVRRGQLLWDEPLSRHTAYGIGGPAEAFFRPADRDELAKVLQFVSQEKIPLTFLGAGSNCLVSDDGVEGIVICLAGTLRNLKIDANRVVAEAGITLGRVVRRSLEAGLTGLEGLIGVPGTLGGALIMNAGAFGDEISTRLVQARTLTLNGREKVYQRENLQFGYRSSGFPPDEIVVEAEFLLEPGAPQVLSDLQHQASKTRRTRQPLAYRSDRLEGLVPSPAKIFWNISKK